MEGIKIQENRYKVVTYVQDGKRIYEEERKMIQGNL